MWAAERERLAAANPSGAAQALARKQSFVDLGCGNGFLTYLLVSEGHPGWGVDVFSRDIWPLCAPRPRRAYPAYACLRTLHI